MQDLGCNGAPPKTSILPKATRFINAFPAPQTAKGYNARSFFHSLPEIQAVSLVYRTMKLHTTPTQHYQTVTRYEDNAVEINAVNFDYSLIVLPEVPPVQWPVSSFDALTQDNFAQIEAIHPDVVILGTGKRQRFIHPRLVASLTGKRIGVECMDNAAACRTYNILMGEGRKVALALIFE
jgi:uncharacterized protein